MFSKLVHLGKEMVPYLHITEIMFSKLVHLGKEMVPYLHITEIIYSNLILYRGFVSFN